MNASTPFNWTNSPLHCSDAILPLPQQKVVYPYRHTIPTTKKSGTQKNDVKHVAQNKNSLTDARKTLFHSGNISFLKNQEASNSI